MPKIISKSCESYVVLIVAVRFFRHM